MHLFLTCSVDGGPQARGYDLREDGAVGGRGVPGDARAADEERRDVERERRDGPGKQILF